MPVTAMPFSSNDRSPDFAAFHQRALAGQRLRVAFLGGSLTWGAQATNPQETSYRALTARKFEETYPGAHFRFFDAAIGGTGSQLAAFRLDRDVLAHSPDLVFLEFTINDDSTPVDPDRLAAYESLVRRMVQQGIPVVQVILPSKKEARPLTPERPLPAEHKKIAQAYRLPVADAITLVRQRVAEGTVTPDELWDAPPDVTHPGDAGYALYAEAAWNAYQSAVKDQVLCRNPEKMLHADTYLTVIRQRLSHFAPLPAGWTIGNPHRSAVAYDFVMSRWLDDIAIARRESGSAGAPQPLTFRIRGRTVLLFGESTPSSGKYEVRIDGGKPQTYDAGVQGGNFPLVKIIAQWSPAASDHEVQITPLLADGQELRLESLCVAGESAHIDLKK
jgi:lysophospholipase L1-like esterase